MSLSTFNLLCETSLRAIGAEQDPPYTPFLPRPAKKESNVPKLKRAAKVLLPNIYIYTVKQPIFAVPTMCMPSFFVIELQKL